MGPWGQLVQTDKEPGPQQRASNRWAVVALVTGVLALVPVAVGAGITALVQTRRRDQAGAGLAVAGLAAAAAWTVIALVVASALALGGGSDPALGRLADAGTTKVGACLLEPAEQDSVSTLVDCARPHAAEVYLADDLDARPWPGYDRVDELADDLCFAAFEDYVGESYDSSDYDYGYFLPDQKEWLDGAHRVVCVVLSPDGAGVRGSVSTHSARG